MSLPLMKLGPDFPQIKKKKSDIPSAPIVIGPWRVDFLYDVGHSDYFHLNFVSMLKTWWGLLIALINICD